LFTEDAAVRDLLVPVLVVVGLSLPVCGVVFVLDGVLIGAGDGSYLARGGLLVLAVYAPVVLVVARLADGAAGRSALVWVWVAFSVVLMGARAVVLLHRERGDAWLVTGTPLH
ncbi:MAG: MATE family efflux transporter, partial [Nocardioides sp.]